MFSALFSVNEMAHKPSVDLPTKEAGLWVQFQQAGVQFNWWHLDNTDSQQGPCCPSTISAGFPVWLRLLEGTTINTLPAESRGPHYDIMGS